MRKHNYRLHYNEETGGYYITDKECTSVYVKEEDDYLITEKVCDRVDMTYNEAEEAVKYIRVSDTGELCMKYLNYGYQIARTKWKEYMLEGYTGSEKNITVPDSIYCVQPAVFKNNMTVEHIDFNVAGRFGNQVCLGCMNLKSAVIPFRPNDKVSSSRKKCLGHGMFRECRSLESVVIGDGVDAVEANCFDKCTSLKYVKLSDGITDFDERSFAGCSSLHSFVLPDSIEYIDFTAFEDTPLKSIYYKGSGKLSKDVLRAIYCVKGITLFILEGMETDYIKEERVHVECIPESEMLKRIQDCYDK